MTRRTDPRTVRAPVPPGEIPAFDPVPRQKVRRDGWTPTRQRDFIEALADTGSVEAACRAVDMSQVGAYLLRRQPGAEGFRAAWEAALDLGVKRIEDVAMDRALNGVEMPVYSYGKLVGTRTSYNDRLLMFMLRNRAPGRFAEGSAKGLNAVGLMEQARLKKQWRAEWEAEQRRVTPAEVHASIERKVEDWRQQIERSHSPRALAAYREYLRIREEDAASGYDAREDPEHPLYVVRAEEAEGETTALPPPGWGKRETEEEREDEGLRWRTLKNEGWE
ncbi:MAG: hypothetical protein ACEQR8_10620 [Cypionkella sp.]